MIKLIKILTMKIELTDILTKFKLPKKTNYELGEICVLGYEKL